VRISSCAVSHAQLLVLVLDGRLQQQGLLLQLLLLQWRRRTRHSCRLGQLLQRRPWTLHPAPARVAAALAPPALSSHLKTVLFLPMLCEL
jgi:hypothetical protein